MVSCTTFTAQVRFPASSAAANAPFATAAASFREREQCAVMRRTFDARDRRNAIHGIATLAADEDSHC